MGQTDHSSGAGDPGDLCGLGSGFGHGRQAIRSALGADPDAMTLSVAPSALTPNRRTVACGASCHAYNVADRR